MSAAIPQSPAATAPFTQGGLWSPTPNLLLHKLKTKIYRAGAEIACTGTLPAQSIFLGYVPYLPAEWADAWEKLQKMAFLFILIRKHLQLQEDGSIFMVYVYT